jgi:hypothetical protein
LTSIPITKKLPDERVNQANALSFFVEKGVPVAIKVLQRELAQTFYQYAAQAVPKTL